MVRAHAPVTPVGHLRLERLIAEDGWTVRRAAEATYATTYLSDDPGAAAYPAWLHHYSHHRPHTGIGGQVPAARVYNLTGNSSAPRRP